MENLTISKLNVFQNELPVCSFDIGSSNQTCLGEERWRDSNMTTSEGHVRIRMKNVKMIDEGEYHVQMILVREAHRQEWKMESGRIAVYVKTPECMKCSDVFIDIIRPYRLSQKNIGTHGMASLWESISGLK